MKHLPLFLLFFSLTAWVGAAEPSPATAPASKKTVRLLTIGNSFSANATRHLPGLVKAAGHTLIHRPLVIGGSSFQVHAEKAQRFEKDPTDKTALYTNQKSLRDLLHVEPWDIVTIQQASRISHDLQTYQPHAGWLAAYIHQHAPQARLWIHQTWAYRSDDPRFTNPAKRKPGEPASQQEMYEKLTAAYRHITAELKAQRIPVGDAFYLADTDPQWGYQIDPIPFDSKKAQPENLPAQLHSLHIGWQWKKQKDGKLSLIMDGHHANTAGEYLGACVWFEILFNESVLDNTYIPPALDPAYAKFLRATAHRAAGPILEKHVE